MGKFRSCGRGFLVLRFNLLGVLRYSVLVCVVE